MTHSIINKTNYFLISISFPLRVGTKGKIVTPIKLHPILISVMLRFFINSCLFFPIVFQNIADDTILVLPASFIAEVMFVASNTKYNHTVACMQEILQKHFVAQ